MFTIDWSVSVGNILTVLVLGMGAIRAYYKIEGDVRMVKHDIKAIEQRQLSLSESLVDITKILAQVAGQQVRLDHVEEDIRDLKKGDGFMLPFPAGSRGPK